MEPLITPRSPFAAAPKIGRGVTWVRPELVCQVKFSNWTQENRLRAPVFLGLRDDVAPEARARGARPPATPRCSRQVDGRSLKFTNLNKLYYPEDGYTKRDLINYYDAVADLILPHLKDRPLSLKRYPNGIHERVLLPEGHAGELAGVAAHG